MPSLPGHSRRALAVAAGLLAAAPVVEAKKKKRKNKKKPVPPPPPLAFATAVITRFGGASASVFQFPLDIGFYHPASETTGQIGTTAGVAATAVSSQLTTFVQDKVSTTLELFGQDIPADRIAVTLL